MDQIIYGRYPLIESLKNKENIVKIFISREARGEPIETIKKLARRAKIPVRMINSSELDKMVSNENHQGVLGKLSAIKYARLDKILSLTKQKEEALILILDRIKDPHNLGAIIRSAHLFGADAIIIPSKEAAGVTETVFKTSAGTVTYMSVIQVTNLVQSIEILKKHDFWIVGVEKGGQDCSKQKLTGKIALVLGSENKGIKELIKKKCDILLSIPTSGKIDSLNVSCAASVLMYELRRN